ncbi:hypothetical protein HHI36_009151 [Cryptolaemus montrouzieri]|uniref:Uncharacterized protein n=1 Tax=Cryptolaemus montrouzieri TaxID=559131 RepID=A0ABD2MUE1_9CUCU
MGKKREPSEAKKCLMKNLKKLATRLDDTLQCQVKPFPCSAPQCTCFCIPNCCPKSPSLTSKSCKSCGPFPPSCTTILPTRKCSPCPSTRCVNTCSRQCIVPCWSSKNCCKQCNCKPKCSCCKPKFCYCQKLCCCQRQCCRFKHCKCCKIHCFLPHVPCCQPRCKPCTLSCCKNQCTEPCCVKFKKCPGGTLCLGCRTICLPRSFSDTILIKKKPCKTLRCSKSTELRGGVLYRGCDCDKKNGLQDQCLRYCCINNPRCKTVPASCHCSKFSCGKHLAKRYGKKTDGRCYTCYICEPPTCNCTPMVPYCPMMKFHRICCCKKHREVECQCCPSCCEVECCCLLPEPCIEPCQPQPCLPCQPPPCLPCPPSFSDETALCYPCGTNKCFCNECIQCVPETETCAVEYCAPRCHSCQTYDFC